MALDPTIPLQTTGGSGPPLAALSSVLDVQNKRQQYQNAQLANQQGQQTLQQGAIDLQERQGVQGVLKNIKNFQDSAGNIDHDKLSAAIYSVAPTTGAAVLNNIATAQSAATGAKSAVNTLDAKTRETVAQVGYSMKGQDPKVVIDAYNNLGTQYPQLKPFTDYAVKFHLQPAAGDPKAFEQQLDMLGKGVQPVSTQQDMNTPGGVSVSDGATSRVVSTKPGTAVPTGEAIPGTETTAQLPPTTQVMGPDGQTSMIGPHSSVAPIDTSGVQGPARGAILADIAKNNPDPSVRAQASQVAQGGQQFPGAVATSLPAGQAQNIANNVDEMNRHFAGLNDQSTGAPLIEGLTGNIKSLATKALTGSNNDKLSYVNGLLSMLPGKGHSDNLKDATDLLEKNIAQLSLGSGGSTDAARALVQAARPNSHMSPEAIGEAADQVASQVRANMAIRNALQGYKMMGDTQGYATSRQKLEQIADPRAFQFEAASPAERVKMLSGLTDADRKTLRDKIQQLEQMGLVK